MKILFTGFEPFGGESVNPAYEAVKRLPEEIAGAQIIKMELPVVFGTAADLLAEKVREERPDAVIAVGQAGGRKAVTPEKAALNLRDARIPDNAGNAPEDEPVREGGPNAYFTRLPVKEMAKQIQALGIPAAVSYTAGTYVCNDLMYSLLDLIETDFPEMKGGFVLVPYIPEQVQDRENVPSLPLADIVSALTVCAEVLTRDPA